MKTSVICSLHHIQAQRRIARVMIHRDTGAVWEIHRDWATDNGAAGK